MKISGFKIGILLVVLISYSSSLAGEENNEFNLAEFFSGAASMYAWLADHKVEGIPGELENPSSQYGVGFGITVPEKNNMEIDLELLILSKEYDTPSSVSGGLFTVVDDDMSLSSVAFLVNARYRQSYQKIHFYLGAGLGLFLSELKLTASTLGMPGSYEDKSSDLGLQFLLGVEYDFTDVSLGAEYRQLNLNGNFSAVTGSGDSDIGGELILLVVRSRF